MLGGVKKRFRSPFLLSLDPDAKLVFQGGEEFGNRHSRLHR